MPFNNEILFQDLIDHEQKADTAFRAEQYKDALSNYEVAMYLSGLIFKFTANRSVSLLVKRARAYLALNDFMQAYHDAKTCLSIDKSIEVSATGLHTSCTGSDLFDLQSFMLMIEVLIGLKAFKQALQYSANITSRFPEHKGLRGLHEKILLELQKADEKHIDGIKIHQNQDLLLKKYASIRPHLRGRTEQLERFKEKATKSVSIGFVPTWKKQRGLYALKDFVTGAIIIKEHKPVVFSTLAVDDRYACTPYFRAPQLTPRAAHSAASGVCDCWAAVKSVASSAFKSVTAANSAARVRGVTTTRACAAWACKS